MRILLYLALFFALNCCATAQRNGKAISKKDQRVLSEARIALETGKWMEANEGFTALIDRYPDDSELFFLRSVALKEQYRFERAADDISKGITLADEPSALPYRKLSEVLSRAGDFGGAKAAAAKFTELRKVDGNGERIAEAESFYRRAFIADSLSRNPVNFAPTPVPGRVNTAESYEYHPTLSIDGTRLIFTRRVNRRQEDFYFSELDETGDWGEAQPLPGINSDFDEGAQTITADGTYLVYTSCNTPGINRGCDLYAADWDGQQWTKGTSLGTSINTEFYEAQPTLSQDGRFLIFASKRPGGKGGADLYISARLGNGGWSNPAPMNALNTSGDEQYPFWAADGRTLYFTSNGLPGMGGDDLFYTRLQADNTWSKPTNLGFPINTAENETNMFIPLRADVAYYSKRYFDDASGQIQIDLYQFPLPLHLRPAPATYVKARVTDIADGSPLVAEVTLEPLSASAPPSSKTTDATGEFLTVLTEGEDYALTVNKAGYLFHSDRFTLADGTPETPFLINIQLAKVGAATTAENTESDGAIAFKNVLFSTGSADLLPVSFIELDRLTELLQGEPDMTVLIAGHTDNVGDEADNLELSRRRAAAVKTYLEQKGIAADRITTEGFGESRPVADNETTAGRAENRRTTFKLR